MAHASLWIGIDAGADDLSVCAVDEEGVVVFEHRCVTKGEAVHELLKSHRRRIDLIGIESGSSSTVLTRSLRKQDYPVAVFEARQASKFLGIRRNKTDKNDARGLADLARLGRTMVSEVRVKSPECQRIRSTLIMRQKLVQLRVTMEGALRSLIRLNGGKVKNSSNVRSFQKNVAEELARLRKDDKIDLREDTLPIMSLAVAARGYVETLDRRLLQQAEAHPVCRQFLQIPGVGPITALSLFSSIEDPYRFTRNADVGAFFGLVPAVRESGQMAVRRRITKAGDKFTRTLLATAAQHHIRWADSAISAWAKGLSSRLRSRGVQVAVARKLAVTMIAMWKSGADYEPFPMLTKSPPNREPSL